MTFRCVSCRGPCAEEDDICETCAAEIEGWATELDAVVEAMQRRLGALLLLPPDTRP